MYDTVTKVSGKTKVIKEFDMKFYQIIEQFEDLSEMANVARIDSGLPFPVWIEYNGASRQVEHNLPRLKVEIDKNRIPYLIDNENPRFLVDVSNIKGIKSREISILNKWIIDNYKTLIDHYNGLITDKEALNTLTHV